MGKSGSVKTTLLNCAGGLEQPDRGIVRCFGMDIHSFSEKSLSLFQRKNIGFVFQFGNLLSYLTVFENISFPLALNGIEGKKREKRVMELLDKIELAESGPALPSELSGGEVQRVSFARAIAHFPKLLLADGLPATLPSSTASPGKDGRPPPQNHKPALLPDVPARRSSSPPARTAPGNQDRVNTRWARF